MTLNFVWILAADFDYVSTTWMLTFVPSNDRQRVCTTVPIIDDNLDEPNELFSVRIIDVSLDSIMVGPNSKSFVTIIDDDGMSYTVYCNITVYHNFSCTHSTGIQYWPTNGERH